MIPIDKEKMDKLILVYFYMKSCSNLVKEKFLFQEDIKLLNWCEENLNKFKDD